MRSDRFAKRMRQQLPAEADAKKRRATRQSRVNEFKFVDQKWICGLLVDIIFAAVDDNACCPFVERRDRLAGGRTCPCKLEALLLEPDRGAIVLIILVM